MEKNKNNKEFGEFEPVSILVFSSWMGKIQTQYRLCVC